jgi:Tol biopolymer transport system component
MLRLTDVSSTIPEVGGAILGEPSLSSSMQSIAMSVITPPFSNRRLFLSPANTLEPRPLSDASLWAGYPVWSPDDRRLAVELKEGSSTHAGVITVDSGAMRKLTNERGQTWAHSWSPDGRKIAAATFRKGRWALQWIDADTGASGTITPPAAPNVYVRYPEWSRRGDVVAYERGELRGNVWMLRLPKR